MAFFIIGIIDADTLEEELALIGLKNLMGVSPHFGVSLGVSEADGGCEFWPVKGPERFIGPWGSVKPSHSLNLSRQRLRQALKC